MRSSWPPDVAGARLVGTRLRLSQSTDRPAHGVHDPMTNLPTGKELPHFTYSGSTSLGTASLMRLSFRTLHAWCSAITTSLSDVTETAGSSSLNDFRYRPSFTP